MTMTALLISAFCIGFACAWWLRKHGIVAWKRQSVDITQKYVALCIDHSNLQKEHDLLKANAKLWQNAKRP